MNIRTPLFYSPINIPIETELPDAWDVQRWRETRHVARRLPQSQLCTCRNRCQQRGRRFRLPFSAHTSGGGRGGGRRRRRRRVFMRRDAQTVMRYIWQTSRPRGVSAPVVLGSGRLMSQWRRTGAQNLDHERQKAVSASAMAIYGKSERSFRQKGDRPAREAAPCVVSRVGHSLRRKKGGVGMNITERAASFYSME